MKIFTKILIVGAVAAGGTGGLATYLFAAPGETIRSTDEMVIRAGEMRDEMLGDLRHCQHLQQIARKDRDIVKLNCINDKLVQIKPMMNEADRARSELMGGGASARAFRSINEDASIIHRLRGEADECIGESLSGIESTNSFSAPQLPDNPYAGFNPGVEPPAYASPFN